MIGEIPLTIDLLKIITKKAQGQEYFTPTDAPIHGKTLTGENCELEYLSGLKYKGRLEDGHLDGKGTLYFRDGVLYEGQFSKGIMIGKGKYFWPDGSNYDGEVVDALREGYGIFRNKAKGIEYKGNWKAGLRDGKGEIGYKSGAVYKGGFKNGERHGFGVIMYASGNFYQGQFKNGKKWGYGEMYWEDTNEVYRGFWQNDRQNGFGEHLWMEKPNKHKNLRNRYEGMFLDGMRHGIGCFYYSDGTRYEGEWVKNRKEGYAFFTDSFGETIAAIFKSDRIHERLNQPREYKIIGFVGSAEEENIKTLTSSKSSVTKSKVSKAEVKDGENKEKSNKIPTRRTMMRSSKTTSKTSFRINKLKNNEDGNKDPVNQPSHKTSSHNTITKNLKKVNKENARKEQERLEKLKDFMKRNEVNQITNPYVKLLRLDDLLELVEDEKERESILSTIEIVMMRYNPLLQSVFQLCKFDPENHSERSFSLKLKIFWRFLRKCKILTPGLTLSQFNKMFYSQEFNEFKLRFQFSDLRERVRDLKLDKFSKTLFNVKKPKGKFSSGLKQTDEEFAKLGNSLGIGLKKIKEAKEVEEFSNSKGRLTYNATRNGERGEELELDVHELSAVSSRDDDSGEDKDEFYDTNYLMSLDPEEREFELMKKNDPSFRNYFADLELPKLDYRAFKSFYNEKLRPFDVPGIDKEENYEKSPFFKTKNDLTQKLRKAYSKDIMLDFYDRNMRKLKKLQKYVKHHEEEIDFAYAEAKKNAQNKPKNSQQEDEIIEIDSPIAEFPKPLEPIKHIVFDIHDGENILLFRNFIDAILRIIYTRENSTFTHFKRKIEKYIEFRIRPLILENRHPDDIFGFQTQKKLKQDHIDEGESFVDRVFFDGLQVKKKPPLKTEPKKNEKLEGGKNTDSKSRVSAMESYTDGLSNTWNSARYSDIIKHDTERDKSNDSSDFKFQDSPTKKKKMKGMGKQIIASCKKILKYVFNKNLKNKFLTTEIEEYYGKVGEATKEMVMDCKSLIDLLQRSDFIKDEEDKDLLIQIVERHYDPENSFTAVMDKCLKQQPFLFMNTQGSFGLSSYYRENPEDYVDPSSLATSEGWRRTVSKHGKEEENKINIKINNRVSAIDMNKIGNNTDEYFRKTEGVNFTRGGRNSSREREHQTERAPVMINEFEFAGNEMKSFDSSPSNAKALLKATENMRDFIGEETASVNSKEMDKRIDMFDKELADALNRTLGSEILFFEFVEIFVIYCYTKYLLIPKRTTPKDLLKVCKRLLKAKKKIKKRVRYPKKWPVNDYDKAKIKIADKAKFEHMMENQKRYQNSKITLREETLKMRLNDQNIIKLMENIEKDQKKKLKELKKAQKKAKQDALKEEKKRKKLEKEKKKKN